MQEDQNSFPDLADHARTPPPEQDKQPVFNLPGVLVAIVATCVLIHVASEYLLSDDWGRWLLLNFAYIPLRFTPEYFQIDLPTILSPVGHTLLHGDWAHLGMNMIWLTAFGAPVAYRIGWLRSLVFWAMTAFGAVLLHTMIYYGDTVPLIGASGAVSGFLGAAARFGFRSNRRNPRAGLVGPLYGPLDSLRQRGVVPFLAIWMAINFVFGSDILGLAGGNSIAWEAHIGGLLTGFFGIAMVDPNQSRT